MGKPIFEPGYWARRLRSTPMEAETMHHAVFCCPLPEWERIAEKHRKILDLHISPRQSILDCGCAWGRLLNLMPSWWRGKYLGVDLCEEFALLAKRLHPTASFMVADLRYIVLGDAPKFDWAVAVSVRGMVVREAGPAAWNLIQSRILEMAKRLLVLEYDSQDEGTVIP